MTTSTINLRPCYGSFASSSPNTTRSNYDASGLLFPSVLKEIARTDDVPYESLTRRLRATNPHRLNNPIHEMHYDDTVYDSCSSRNLVTQDAHYDDAEDPVPDAISDTEEYDQYEEFNAHLTRW